MATCERRPVPKPKDEVVLVLTEYEAKVVRHVLDRCERQSPAGSVAYRIWKAMSKADSPMFTTVALDNTMRDLRGLPGEDD